MKTCCLFFVSSFFVLNASRAQNQAAHFTGFSQYYRCGDITVTGTQITVEALVRVDGTGPFTFGQSAHDIVSKHNGAGDANYILRPDHAEISTTNGHYISSLTGFTTFIRDSFYHVALTYDGASFKFYVNGCLYSQTPATGSLMTNSYLTTIGQLASNPTSIANEQLYGYADEVRIWSVARSEADIRNYMKNLPNPTTQTGLLAYYKFEGNSNNIQGNSAYNAIPFGSPVIETQNGFDRIQLFNARYTIQNPLCGNTGSIIVLAEGGKTPYRYSLNGGPYQSSNTFNLLGPGSYLVSVRSDGVGCSKDTTIILTQNCSTNSCNNWLRLPSQPSYVRVGDLDIPGNQLTIEASFIRTSPWIGTDVFQGDLVSKHEAPNDCNYLLRPSSAEITTTNGYFKTPTICPIELNKMYHAAMVYDGTTLKFYRNGFLMSQIAASGNLIQNNWQTQIGLYFNQITQENFIGYINEVRIWNVARSQNQIQTYMNQSLPSPQTTAGLLAYYTFEDLLNKQGNPTWNGSLGGSASINQTNPNCNFVADSCGVQQTVSPCNGFQLAFGTSAFDRGYDIAPSANNEFFAVGVTRINGNDDILIKKLNLNGTIIWSKRFGGNNAESVRKISATSDGGLLIVGQTRSFGNSNGDILCFKVSNTGTILWSRRFGVGSSSGDLGMDIIETSDEGYAISGILNVNGGVADAVLIKLDNSANVVWSKRFDRMDGEDGVGIVQKGDTLIVATDLQNGAGHYTIALTKLKLADGSVLFAKLLTPSVRGLFNPYLYKNPAASGYIISGHTTDVTSYTNMQHTIITVNDNFDIVSTKMISVNPVTNDFYTGFVPLPDGSFIGTASPQNNSDGYIYRVASNNSILFAKKFKGSSDRRLYRIAMTGQDILAIGGTVINGQEDVFITKLKTDGTISPDCEVENVSISVQQPVYNSVAFYWPFVSNTSFSNTNISLPDQILSLIKTDICPKPAFDFSFQQNLCSPATVQFSSNLSGISSLQWDFGNGQTNNSSPNPIVTYSASGSYPVKLKVQYGGGCSDSLVKTIVVSNVYDTSLIFNNDTTICLGDSVRLNTNEALNFCWRSSAVSVPPSLNAFVKPTDTTTYILTSEVTGNNLIINGNFNAGNSGFTSQYSYNSASGFNPGVYHVSSNIQAWNPGMSACMDHTTGSGNMMMVNGSTQSNVRIWSQTISVQPNTNYVFYTWLQTLTTVNPAQLQFSINGAAIGNIFVANAQSCVWQRFNSTWNSGNNTSATISVLNMNQGSGGNDFALDDIFFGEVITKTDSFTVNVTGLCDSVKLSGPDKICNRTDTLTYSIYKSPDCTQQYSLQVDPAFADIILQTSTTLKLVFKQNGTTSIRVAYSNDCKMVIDSLAVTIRFSPTSINIGPDITTCKDTSLQLNAGNGFITYTWQNGSTDSTFNINSPGTYYVTAQNLCNVQFTDTLQYIKLPVTPFGAQPLFVKACRGDSLQLSATGGNIYSWSPSGNFNNPFSSSPRAIVNVTQNFSVRISDTACDRDTTIIIPVTASPGANISVAKSNDVNCSQDSAILTVSGGNSYTWLPNQYITRNTGDRVTVKPIQNTTFYVVGRDAFGCSGKDSVIVTFSKDGKQKLFVPTAFTPNGDGLNDYFKPVFTGPSSKYDFKIFNRWGQLIFHSKKPGEGWDGRFKGVLQRSDVFVFYITAEGGCNGKFEQKGTIALIR